MWESFALTFHATRVYSSQDLLHLSKETKWWRLLGSSGSNLRAFTFSQIMRPNLPPIQFIPRGYHYLKLLPLDSFGYHGWLLHFNVCMCVVQNVWLHLSGCPDPPLRSVLPLTGVNSRINHVALGIMSLWFLRLCSSFLWTMNFRRAHPRFSALNSSILHNFLFTYLHWKENIKLVELNSLGFSL